jgi:hypothetical protein
MAFITCAEHTGSGTVFHTGETNNFGTAAYPVRDTADYLPQWSFENGLQAVRWS